MMGLRSSKLIGFGGSYTLGFGGPYLVQQITPRETSTCIGGKDLKIICRKLLTHTATQSSRPRKERSDRIVRVLRSIGMTLYASVKGESRFVFIGAIL